MCINDQEDDAKDEVKVGMMKSWKEDEYGDKDRNEVRCGSGKEEQRRKWK